MFGVSSKVDYGLIIIFDLSGLAENQYLSLVDIANKRNLSANYLAQVVLPLKEADIIESKEGKFGWHRLIKGLSQIYLSDIIKAYEGDISFVPCLNEKLVCKSEPFCVTKDVWKKVQDDFMYYAEKKSLKELLSWFQSSELRV